jgi:glycosyltransferase involved in cell wall biosynthesis
MPANPALPPAESYRDLRFRPSAPADVAVLIPAYQPSGALERLIARLDQAGVPVVLVVDDGSSPAYLPLFERLALHPRVHLLRHARNQGKGSALKTGVRYFLSHLSHFKGLVTAGADGQHAADDVLRLAATLHRSPRLAILGTRTIRLTGNPGSGRAVPLGSILRNCLTAALFRAVTRVPLTDTQTGLRALPATLLPRLLDLPGSRYEFEMAVLLYIARTLHPLAEQPIRIPTGSGAGNPVSHFRPLADSLRVLRVFLSRPTPLALAPAYSSSIESARALDLASSARTLRAK